MKAERSWMLILITLSLWVPTGKAQELKPFRKISFDQALEMTHQRSYTLKQAQLHQQEKAQEVKAAKGLYLPRFDISANYMAISEDLTLDLSPVRDAITPLYDALGHFGDFSGVPNPDPNTNQQMPFLPDELSTAAVRAKMLEGLNDVQNAEWDQMIQKKAFGTVAASVQWPIYAGGKIRAANKAAAIYEQEAVEKTRQKSGELLSELAERYYGLVLARQAVQVRQQVYTGMEQHLQDALKMEKAGFIAQADVLHAKVFHAQAEREMSKAKRTESILRDALRNTMAWEGEEILIPVSKLFYLDSIESMDYFKALARTHSPLLKQVAAKKALAEQNQRVARSNYMPTIGMQGMYDIVNKDLSPYAPEWMIGLGLKWNLFDGLGRERKVKAASIKTQQVVQFQSKAQSDIESMINKLYHELQMYQEQLNELETAMDFTQEYVRIREKAFHEEMSNSTEVVDARLALAKVRIERLQAMYNYDISLARLLAYCGQPEAFSGYQQRSNSKTEHFN